MKKPLDEFLSECSEVHALWYGFFYSWKSLSRVKLPDGVKEEIEKEFHYYTFGFFIGRAVQAAILLITGATLTL